MGHALQNYSHDQIKNYEMGGECRTYGEEDRLIQGFDTELERKRRYGKLGCRQEDNIKRHLKEIG